MKTALIVSVAALVGLSALGQYKAPSQYFRKDFPAPVKGAQQQPQAPQRPGATAPSQPQAPAPQPVQKFKDVSTNSQFYFLTDTNRAYPWTKISATVATNTKNGARQTFSPEMPIQR